MASEFKEHADRPYTYRVTFLSLAVGVIAAAAVGLLLLALRQPLLAVSGGAPVSVGSLMIPLAGLASIGILLWSVFFLPVAWAKRRSLTLDPDIWPTTGATAVFILVLSIFALGMLSGIF